MRHPWQIWSVFAACLVVATAAVGWLSYRALESERAEGIARAQTALEESVRLVLWRLDAAIAPLITQENAYPVSVYQPMIPPDGDKQIQQQILPWVPSPLMRASDPRIKLHFEFDGAQRWRSPEVPSDQDFKFLPPNLLSATQLRKNRDLLHELEIEIDAIPLAAELERMQPALAALPPPVPAGPEQPLSQQALSSNDFQYRQQAISANSEVIVNSNAGVVAGLNFLLRSQGLGEPLTPLWIDGRLLLVRRAVVEGNWIVQGCWLDWPLIREQLLPTARNLLPGATLKPARGSDDALLARRMAALPVVLRTGTLPEAGAAGLTPVGLSLVITWASLAVAALAIALLLHGVLALSERRAAFVSAVTHELRTPLTTFRMYAEMLAEGMVAEADRRRYLETLQIEAGRLSHLVENVLAYARLERGRPTGRIFPVPVGQLLERASERLTARAAAAGFVVEQHAPAEVLATSAVADPAAVEQILFNLVDNACKYAQAADDRRLRLEAAAENGHVLIRLRDAGPGVSPMERKRLFQPFRKSARDAAQSSPGVGLGLALCRRLARDMGGELKLDDATSAGASFVLTLKTTPAG